MAANDRQEGGNHYRKAKVQHWDAIKDWMTPEQYKGYLLGSASKYLARYNDKDGPGGVKKSIHYLQKLLEFLEETETTPTKPNPDLDDNGNRTVVKYSPMQYPNTSPRSNDDYTYEGGTAQKELYRCKKCGEHFDTPVHGDPYMHHSHAFDATASYINQDK